MSAWVPYLLVWTGLMLTLNVVLWAVMRKNRRNGRRGR